MLTVFKDFLTIKFNFQLARAKKSRNFSDTLENLVKFEIVQNIIRLAQDIFNKLQIWEN
jgi:hypothetical protein